MKPPARTLRIAMIGVRGLATVSSSQSIQRATIGGAELAAEEVARWMAKRGHEVTFFTRGGERTTVADRLVLEPTWFVPGRGVEALSHSFWASLRAVRERFDLVHFHAVGPGSFAGITRLGTLPSVITVQGLDWEREKWRWWEKQVLRRLAVFGLRNADACVVVSPSLEQPVRELGARSVVCIPNGFSDPGVVQEALQDQFRLRPRNYLLVMARLVPEKNIDRIVAAYKRAGIPWPLVIAGGGVEGDEYVATLHQMADGADVRWVGVVGGAEKSTLIGLAGGFVNASSLEGLSLALLEALGVGVPVAISPIPGNTDVFRMAGSGPEPIYCDPNDPENMVRALRALTTLSPVQRDSWRQFADQIRRAFAWDHVAEQVEELYHTIVRRPENVSLDGRGH